MCKRKKISINLDVHMLADSDNDNVRDLNANEHRKDGLKSKSIEKECVQKREGKLRHQLMVGPSSLSSFGTAPFCCPRRLVT